MLIAKKLGAYVISVDQSVDVHNPILKDLIKNLYNELDQIVVREPISYENLVSMGVIPDKIKIAADTAFLAEPASFKEIERLIVQEGIDKETVGIMVRGDRNPNLFAWEQIVKKLTEQLSKKVKIKVIEGDYNVGGLISIISSLSLLISVRYHGNVFGIIAKTPLVPIKGNTCKTEGFLECLGIL